MLQSQCVNDSQLKALITPSTKHHYQSNKGCRQTSDMTFRSNDWFVDSTGNSLFCHCHPNNYPHNLYHICAWVFLSVCVCARVCVCACAPLTWQLREKKSWHEMLWSITVWCPMTFTAVQHTRSHTHSPTHTHTHTHTHSVLPLSSQLYWIEEPLMENSRKEKDLPTPSNIQWWRRR